MLNIPEEVKRLLKQDSVRKNFRVHFPNGEYDDITNGNLVAESVVLTESLCSEQNIKFGLCEASQLEFETIGVGNIKGCEIEAFIEVDISNTEISQYIDGGENFKYWNNAISFLKSMSAWGRDVDKIYIVTPNTATFIATNVLAGDRYMSSGYVPSTALQSDGQAWGTTTQLSDYGFVQSNIVADVSGGNTSGFTITTNGEGILIGQNGYRMNDDTGWTMSYFMILSLGNSMASELLKDKNAEELSKLTNIDNYIKNPTVTWNDGATAFQIPYGTFIVDSSKRQNDMYKRKIIALSKKISSSIELSPIEKAKEKYEMSTDSNYTVDLLKTLYSNVNGINSSMYTEVEREVETGKISLIQSSLIERYNVTVCEGGYIPIVSGGEDEQKLFKVTLNKVINYNEVVQDIKNTMGSLESWCDVFYALTSYNSKTMFSLNETRYIPNSQGNFIYPYIPNVDSDFEYGKIFIPLKIKVYERDKTDATYEVLLHEWTIATSYSVSELTPIGLFDDKTISLERKQISDSRYAVSSYLDINQLLQGWVEIQGKFIHESRYGALEFINIIENSGLYPRDDLYPSDSLYPKEANVIADRSLYSDLYYEEYTVKKYGKIIVPFKNDKGEKEDFIYRFNYDNENVYDMSNNYIFNNLVFAKDEIKTILNNYFIPNIEKITYVPADITMKGLPYIEAGDIINVITQDSGFETIVWQRVLKGIQALTDDITATGDEVNSDRSDISELVIEEIV